MRLQDLYAAYSDRVQFLMIYIREAHPTDGWAIPAPGRKELADPKTIEERRAVRTSCFACGRCYRSCPVHRVGATGGAAPQPDATSQPADRVA